MKCVLEKLSITFDGAADTFDFDKQTRAPACAAERKINSTTSARILRNNLLGVSVIPTEHAQDRNHNPQRYRRFIRICTVSETQFYTLK
ncbi:MAG: hypothetical protein CVT72_10000 [Alphaproteobacteria bacterium HGW-Alphaproteobacteria-11]|nr:MAG: hypothetical protein CVT72_10000 [Alphaproteobacteria bacterium HGW-Alphaproteobacteria-11]